MCPLLLAGPEQTNLISDWFLLICVFSSQWYLCPLSTHSCLCWITFSLWAFHQPPASSSVFIQSHHEWIPTGLCHLQFKLLSLPLPGYEVTETLHSFFFKNTLQQSSHHLWFCIFSLWFNYSPHKIQMDFLFSTKSPQS